MRDGARVCGAWGRARVSRVGGGRCKTPRWTSRATGTHVTALEVREAAVAWRTMTVAVQPERCDASILQTFLSASRKADVSTFGTSHVASLTLSVEFSIVSTMEAPASCATIWPFGPLPS